MPIVLIRPLTNSKLIDRSLPHGTSSRHAEGREPMVRRARPTYYLICGLFHPDTRHANAMPLLSRMSLPLLHASSSSQGDRSSKDGCDLSLVGENAKQATHRPCPTHIENESTLRQGSPTVNCSAIAPSQRSTPTRALKKQPAAHTRCNPLTQLPLSSQLDPHLTQIAMAHSAAQPVTRYRDSSLQVSPPSVGV